VDHGATSDVVASYMRRLSQRSGRTSSLADARRPIRDLEKDVELIEAELVADNGGVFAADARIEFDVGVRAHRDVPGFRISYSISSYDGTVVGNAFSSPLAGLAAGEEATFRFAARDLALAPGRYNCDLATASGDNLTGYRAFDIVTDVLDFEMAAPQADDGTVGYWERSWGVVRFPTPTVTRRESARQDAPRER
jgi:hypothetical protein